MSFENFPYTNFHELNLDWLIKKVKEAYSPDNPPENVVLSVNGETGDVVLYTNAIVRFPDVEEGTWNIHRVADNKSSGIEFEVGNVAKRIDGTFRYPIYDAGNPPPYPVNSVNGQTGNVLITIPVTSVNGMTGAITLYPNAAIAFPDVEATTWNMYRGSGPEGSSKITGIQFQKDNPAQRINGNDRYNVYDEGNPPPYPVTSVGTLTGAVAILDTTIVVDGNTQKLKITFPVTSIDGQTGEVETWGYTSDRDAVLPIEADANAWGLKREVPSGLLGIDFEYDNTTEVYEGYLTFKADGSSTTQRVKILTPADIPSSSGVVSINGLNGVVVLTAADIAIGSGDSTTTANAIAAALADMADNWSDQNNYLQGAYVIYNRTLYKATANNTAGTWASQSWTATTIAAELAARDTAISAIAADLTDKVNEDVITPTPEDTLYASENYSIGDYILIQGKLYKAIASISDGDLFDNNNVQACTVGEEITSLSKQIANLNNGEDISSQVTATSSNSILYAKKFGKRIIIVGVSSKITTDNSYQSVATIASGYRPNYSAVGVAREITASDFGYGHVEANTNGTLEVIWSKTTTYGLQFSIEYLIP